MGRSGAENGGQRKIQNVKILVFIDKRESEFQDPFQSKIRPIQQIFGPDRSPSRGILGSVSVFLCVCPSVFFIDSSFVEVFKQ